MIVLLYSTDLITFFKLDMFHCTTLKEEQYHHHATQFCEFKKIQLMNCTINGTKTIEKLYIWHSPMLFLESPLRAESYSTGIKSKTDINFAKSLWYFHPRYAYDYTFE